MKILFPLTRAGTGTDIFTDNLASGLRKLTHTADMKFLPGWSGFIPPVMGKLCDTSTYDLIHANSWNGFGFTGSKPLVVTEHLVVHDPLLNPYKTRLQRFYHSYIFHNEQKSFVSADIVVSISKYVQKKMQEEFGFYDSTLIFNGIDETVFNRVTIERTSFLKKYSIPEDKKIIFFAGNPTSRKGGDLLPRIMNNLGDDYVLIITGGLREKSNFKTPNIISTGKIPTSELIAAYNISDLFLFPSRLEGFCLSILEAMSCGIPVVTTNVSSLPEQVIDEKGGVLCPIDDISAFTNAIRYITEDENLMKKMGNFNRQRILDLFTLDKMTREYVKIYEKLV
ncbi:glycosyltransferase family 4 protein [Methanospirillum sp. J.3.6.1-F.2.7.3]|uniref:Glycosyltransferase family 4 protein n=1 Tax=Methanospirillum purgamenti TaxID=2834276 RepID=A0A8E7EHN0_9EURY|nr:MULTISPECIES: glycosyltransferase family 4 protein [Methanospirillum]MDX8551859.1 glycosyltransferase family 4 protein [Methanospirillum hungatei]QVV89172.1 glycosyltransferase family 4 protein [Methanospirillum sp. J.3.6.1-F.2.7.3]